MLTSSLIPFPPSSSASPPPCSNSFILSEKLPLPPPPLPTKSLPLIGVSSTMPSPSLSLPAIDRERGATGVSNNPDKPGDEGMSPSHSPEELKRPAGMGRCWGWERCWSFWATAAGAAFLAIIGDDDGTPPMGVSCNVGKENVVCRKGVTWTWSVLPALLLSRFANLRGRVEEGTTEALEGGRSSLGCDREVSVASASLKRLLAGVALT